MKKQPNVSRPAAGQPQVEPARPATKRKARRSWSFWLLSRLFVLLLVVGVIVFFAPILIGHFGLWKQILPLASPALAKQIDVASLQLGWFSPIEVHGLAVKDGDQPLAEIPLIKSRKTLLSIALNSNDVGTFEVDQPKAKLVLRRDGSNVEDFLAKLPKSQGGSSTVGVGLVLSGGTVEFVDQIAGREWKIEKAAAEIHSPASAREATTGKLSADVKSAADNSVAGQVTAEFSWQPSAGEKSPASGQAQVRLIGLPTELAQGALQRLGRDIKPRGPVTLQASGALKPDGALQLLVNSLTTPGITIESPSLLTTDRPTIVINSAQGALQLAGGHLTIPNLQLASNVITIGGQGSAPIDAKVPAQSGTASSGDLQISGQINAAALARQLPATLHIRDGSRLDSGLADFTLSSQAIADGRRWAGSLKTHDFRGIAAARPIEFDQPLQIDFSVLQSAAGPVIERMIAQASFLRLEGRGSLSEGSLSAQTDLNKLVDELARIIDWGDTELQGALTADFRWKHSPADGWNATADARATNFKLIAPGLAPWQERSLRLTAAAHANLQDGKLKQIDSARFGIEAGADKLDAELTEVVKSPNGIASVFAAGTPSQGSAPAAVPLKFSLHGDLGSWRARLQPFIPLTGWGISGGIDANGSARISAQQAELGQTSVQISQLAALRLVKGTDDVVREAVAIREPVIKIETSGSLDRAKSKLQLGSTTFASSTVAFRADGLRAMLGKEPSLVGAMDLRADLAKLHGWFPGASPPTSRLEGAAEGHLDIGYRGQVLVANWSAKVDELKYLVNSGTPATPTERTTFAAAQQSPSWRTIWQEPRVTLDGQGTFDQAAGSLKVDRCTLAATSATVGLTGSVTKLTAGSPEVDLAGELAYDLSDLTRQVQANAQQPDGSAPPMSLNTLQLVGKEKRPFTLKGPLFASTSNMTPAQSTAGGPAGATERGVLSTALVGDASLRWEGAQYVGLVAGPADFPAHLAGGMLNIGPLNIPVAEGRLTTAPRILLNQPQPLVIIDRGPLLTDIRLSPEMCSMWLKYVTPLVAQATRAEGKLSLSLNGATLPLDAPLNSDVVGALTIQSAQIGPGPFGQEVLGMGRELLSFIGMASGQSGANNSVAFLSFPQQDVPFEVKNGVVEHRGLKVDLGELQITTKGTVNLTTEEYDLTASVALPENLLQNRDGLLASLRGQPLEIPIRGSFNRPPNLRGEIARFFQQNAGNAVRNIIGNQIERRLQGDGGLLQRGEGLLRGQTDGTNSGGANTGGLLQRELGQGLNRLFGPTQPPTQPQQPTAPPR